MPNQKLEKAAPVTTMSQFLPLPAVWQQQPKMAKTSTKTKNFSHISVNGDLKP